MIEIRSHPAQATATVGRVSINSPERLHIRGGGAVSHGAHQIWYPGWIQRMGGCGPTAASNLLWYLASTRPESCGPLFEGDATNRAEMLRLMEAVWKYVTPGMRGVDKASTLADGAVRFGADRRIPLRARVLEIPAKAAPNSEAVLDFLATAFCEDLPVAFLNLSNGAVRNLDNWHWVTLVGVDENLQAEMYDQSRRQLVDVGLWLDSTKGSGAFVALEPA